MEKLIIAPFVDELENDIYTFESEWMRNPHRALHSFLRREKQKYILREQEIISTFTKENKQLAKERV